MKSLSSTGTCKYTELPSPVVVLLPLCTPAQHDKRERGNEPGVVRAVGWTRDWSLEPRFVCDEQDLVKRSSE